MHTTHANPNRKCADCGKERKASDFPFVSKKIQSERKRYPAKCNECWKKYKAGWAKEKRKNNKEWRERVNKQSSNRYHRDKQRFLDYSRKRLYGITPEEIDRLYQKQKGICLICLEAITRLSACVDHNHQTRKIRGLLCKRCNGGMGALGDNPDRLKRAIKYLKENN